jgi:hypothetical protein
LISKVLPTGRLKEHPAYIDYWVGDALCFLLANVFTRPVAIIPFSGVLKLKLKT